MIHTKRTPPKFGRIIHEAMSGVVQRSSRSSLAIVGIALSVGSLVAVLGVTASANAQIGAEFLHADATNITVVPNSTSATGEQFPENAESLVLGIEGVAAVGRFWPISDAVASSLPVALAQPPNSQPPVLAASAGYWAVVDPILTSGRAFDAALEDQPVAVIGKRIAEEFNLGDLRNQPAILLDGTPFTVIGIVEDTQGSSAAISSVTIPAEYARSHFEPPGRAETMTVDADRGASAVVAAQISLALDPRNLEKYQVTAPPPPTVVRDRISSSTNGLLLALALIGLVVSGVGVANVSLVGVIARSREIALRRSLGALPRHIAAQFLLESAVRGLLGGAFGTIVAVIAVVVVALVMRWTAVIEPLTVIGGSLIGLIVGTVAGVYPTMRATQVQPIEAFRR